MQKVDDGEKFVQEHLAEIDAAKQLTESRPEFVRILLAYAQRHLTRDDSFA
jgi:hypothetical protein